MKVIAWINVRFPLTELWEQHVSKYYVPKNLNFWYFFGVFSLIVLINQFVTGIWLAMYYTPTAAGAFNSVEHIMRDVKFGWLIRYMHSTGASAFFIVIYLHMYRGIMYGSFKAPRELLWIIGMLLFSLLLLEAGSGYVLPWGQMSYWATKVLVGVYTVIPFFGKAVSRWITGDFNVSGVTLHRFFALHVVAFPLLIIGMVVLHIMALHHVGSNNPDGKELQKKDKIPFHPYYSVKDFMGIIAFLFVFFLVIFFFPTGGGYLLEHANFQPANPLVTPQHIAPPWYLASIYAILRAIPNKLMGVVSAAAAVAFLFVLPWLDRCKTKSIRYRGNNFKIWLVLFVISYIGLGVCGTMPLTIDNLAFSRLFMIIYFGFFIALPFHSHREQNRKR